MKKFISSIILTMTMVGCTATTQMNADHAQVKYAPWSEAVQVIQNGDYISLSQTHDNTVRIIRNNSHVIETKQPHIDAVLDVVRNCSKCKNKPIMTE